MQDLGIPLALTMVNTTHMTSQFSLSANLSLRKSKVKSISLFIVEDRGITADRLPG